MRAVITTEVAKKNISANVQRLLADRNWSTRQLVEATREPQNSVYRAVRGDNEPGAVLLSRMAEALGVSVDELLSEPPSPRRPRKSA